MKQKLSLTSFFCILLINCASTEKYSADIDNCEIVRKKSDSILDTNKNLAGGAVTGAGVAEAIATTKNMYLWPPEILLSGVIGAAIAESQGESNERLTKEAILNACGFYVESN